MADNDQAGGLQAPERLNTSVLSQIDAASQEVTDKVIKESSDEAVFDSKTENIVTEDRNR
jgi:hypothetical protein